MSRFAIETIFKAVDRMSRPIRKMSRSMGRFSRRAEAGLRGVDKAIKRVARSLERPLKLGLKVATIGVAGLTTGFGLLINEFSKVENAQAAFQPILGSAEKAAELVEKINQMAATTPFQFDVLADATKTLIAMGAAGEDNVIPMLRSLGDLAGGNRDALQRMAVNFAEISANGKAMTRDLRQFTTAGVPLIKELADMMGKGTAEIQDMASAGEITSELVTQAINNMTSAGGRFFKGMEISSKTTSGRLSTLRDNISLTAAAIGEGLAPAFKELIIELTRLAQKARKWANENKELINVQFRAFIKFVRENIPLWIEWAKKVGKFIVVFGGFVIVLKTVIGLLTLFNTIVALSPIGKFIVLLTSLVVLFKYVIKGIQVIAGWIAKLMKMFPALGLIIGAFMVGPIAGIIATAAIIIAAWDELKIWWHAFWIGAGKIAKKVGWAFEKVWDGATWAFRKFADVVVWLWDHSLGPIFDGIVWMYDKLEAAGSFIKSGAQSAAEMLGLGTKDEFERNGEANAQLLQDVTGTMMSAIAPNFAAQMTAAQNSMATTQSEVTIRDETGKAEVTKSPQGSANKLILLSTGEFNK